MSTLPPISGISRSPVVSAWDQITPAVRDLVERASDPNTEIRGSNWTVRRLIAHLVSALECYCDMLRGTPSPVRSMRAGDVAALNDELIDRVLDRGVDLGEQLDRAQRTWRELLGQPRLPELVTYHCGQRIPPMSLAAGFLYEPVLHGHDLAVTLGRPWPIDPEHVDLIMRGLSAVMPHAVVAERARGFSATVELRLRGQGTYTFRFVEGTLSVGGRHDGRIDCRISADPATYLLVTSGRRGPIVPALTGRMTVFGRKPWLAGRMATVFEPP